MSTTETPEATDPTARADQSDRSNAEWLRQRLDKYRARVNDMCEAIEDSDDLDKLGQGFTLADPLEKVDMCDGTIPRRPL